MHRASPSIYRREHLVLVGVSIFFPLAALATYGMGRLIERMGW